MGFYALAFIKDKDRNRLGAEHPMHLGLSGVGSQFQKLFEAKWR